MAERILVDMNLVVRWLLLEKCQMRRWGGVYIQEVLFLFLCRRSWWNKNLESRDGHCFI